MLAASREQGPAGECRIPEPRAGSRDPRGHGKGQALPFLGAPAPGPSSFRQPQGCSACLGIARLPQLLRSAGGKESGCARREGQGAIVPAPASWAPAPAAGLSWRPVAGGGGTLSACAPDPAAALPHSGFRHPRCSPPCSPGRIQLCRLMPVSVGRAAPASSPAPALLPAPQAAAGLDSCAVHHAPSVGRRSRCPAPGCAARLLRGAGTQPCHVWAGSRGQRGPGMGQ